MDALDQVEVTEEKPAEKKAGPSDPVTIKLRVPIPFGKEQMIDELTLKPVSRAFKDFELPMREDGTFLFRPYPLAIVGLKMAGHSAGATMLVDKLDPRDLLEVAQSVFAFFG